MITFENIQQLEKYTLMTMHGLFNQLKLGIISIDNAEHTLFTPYMMETFPRCETRHYRFNSQRDRVRRLCSI